MATTTGDRPGRLYGRCASDFLLVKYKMAFFRRKYRLTKPEATESRYKCKRKYFGHYLIGLSSEHPQMNGCGMAVKLAAQSQGKGPGREGESFFPLLGI